MEIPVSSEPLRLEGTFYTPVPPIPPPLYDENEPLTEKETEVTKDKVLPSTKDIQPPVFQKSHDPVNPVSSPISLEPSSAQVDNSPLSKESSRETKLPYPSRVEREKKDSNDKVQIQKFWEMFKKIHVDITLADALILMPKYQKMLKKACWTNKESAAIISCPCSIEENWLPDLTNFVADPRCSFDTGSNMFVKPESNDDSQQSAIVDDFESLLTLSHGSSEVVKCDFLTTNGDPITPPFTIPTKKDLTNEKVEKHEVKTCNISRESSSICPSIKEKLNFWKNKEVLEKNEILKRNNTCDFQTPSSSLGKKEVEGEKTLDVKTIVSFFAPIGNCVRKWATNEFVKDNDEINHEVFKSDNENVLGVHDNEEEEIAFLDGLLEDENFFEINDKKVESLERKTKEDFETKVEPKFKKELQVFHPDIEILNHFETTSYVGSDYVFYEDFNLVDMIFPMNIQGKIFDPGITFHEKSFEKDAFKDKSSKELAPSKALLTLDVFDPLHPPLMDFHVTKAFSGFTFSLLKIFSKKFFEPGIKNATGQAFTNPIALKCEEQEMM
ncbi:hypothetical protein Tco_1430259 [Tanacetum coccineum]